MSALLVGMKLPSILTRLTAWFQREPVRLSQLDRPGQWSL